MLRSFFKSATILGVVTATLVNVAAANTDTQRKQRLMIGKAPGPTATFNPQLGFGTIGKPDLIILPRYAGNSNMPNTGYCGAWNGGNQSVRFYVKNIGNAVAPQSYVQVNFGGSNYGLVAVPSLAPNKQIARSRAIPASAWSPGGHSSVQFLIAADHNDAMNEISVTNNYGQGTCQGPAT